VMVSLFTGDVVDRLTEESFFPRSTLR